MEFALTMLICSVINGKAVCMPPITFDETFVDGYSCMIDGYQKSKDKIQEIGKEDVNKFNIYIKFGCNENNAHNTSKKGQPI